MSRCIKSHLKSLKTMDFPAVLFLQDRAVASLTTSRSAPQELPERSAHFYRARVPEHFRQLVNESIHENKKNKLGSSRTASRRALRGAVDLRTEVGESFQWDTFRFAAPMLNSCAAICEIATLILASRRLSSLGVLMPLQNAFGPM